MSKEAESSYRDLVKQHNKFLRRNPDATDQERRRPLQFIETPGIECGLWPTLYWCTEMCETVERATDARRLKRLGHAVALNDDSDEENPGERHSIKRSFMRKVLSPIIAWPLGRSPFLTTPSSWTRWQSAVVAGCKLPAWKPCTLPMCSRS